jgi:pimeloyl-ACP methyl ester carboxylesterase
MKNYLIILGFANNKEYIINFKNLFHEDLVYIVYPSFNKSYLEEIEVFFQSNKDIYLIGYSIGCIISLNIYPKYLKKIKKLILISPPSRFAYNYNNLLNNKYLVTILKNVLSLPYFGRWLFKYIYCRTNIMVPFYIVKAFDHIDIPYNFNLLNDLLIKSNLNNLINKVDHKIDIIIGDNDDFIFVSYFLYSYFDNIIIHRMNGDHHVLNKNYSHIYNILSII